MKLTCHLMLGMLFLCLQAVAVNVAYVTASKRMNPGKNLARVFPREDSCDVYASGDIPRLIGRLKEYDAVVLQLYFEKADWKAFGAALKCWLEKGGVLVSTGAECSQIVTQLYGQFGKGWTLDRTSCVLGKDQQKILEYSLGSQVDSVMEFPFDVTRDMRASQGWAHYTKVSPDWKVIGRCPKGHPAILKRGLGKGMVYSLVNHSPNNMTGKSVFWYRFVKNALCQQALEHAGVRIVSYGYSPSFGRHELKLTFRNRTPLVFQARIMVGEKVLADKTARLEAGDCFVMPYAIGEAGELMVRFVIGSGSQAKVISFQRDVIVPVALRAGFLSYRPGILHAAPFRLEVDPAFAKRCSLRLEVDGRRVEKVSLDSFPRPCVADLSGLKAGRHTAQVIMDVQGREYYRTPELAIAVDAGNPALMVDEEGFLTRHGKRFFPIGLYTHKLIAKGCGYLSEQGFDSMGAEYWNPKRFEVMDRLLADSLKQKMTIILSGAPHMLKKMLRSGNIPAERLILEFGDEPDLYGTTPEQAHERVRNLKRLDADAPSFMCLCKLQSLDGRYNGTTDIIAHDNYPVPYRPLDDVYVHLSKLVRQMEGWCRMPAAVPQCFGYPTYPDSWWPTLPTPAEMLNMYFQALVAGVKGLRFYVWADGSFNIEEHPEMEKALMDFVRWVRRHESFLLSSDQRELPAGKDSRVYGREWRVSGKVLRIYVNASKDKAQSHGMAFSPREVKILVDGRPVEI